MKTPGSGMHSMLPRPHLLELNLGLRESPSNDVLLWIGITIMPRPLVQTNNTRYLQLHEAVRTCGCVRCARALTEPAYSCQPFSVSFQSQSEVDGCEFERALRWFPTSLARPTPPKSLCIPASSGLHCGRDAEVGPLFNFALQQ